MSSIVMALVDDHYVHGQVGMHWCTKVDADLIIVVNDELASDKMHQGLLDMAVLDGIHTRYYTLDKAIKKLTHFESNTKRAMIICDSISDLTSLIEAGVEIPNIVISSIKHLPGRHRITSSVALSNDELQELKLIDNKESNIFLWRVPDEEKTELSEITLNE